MAWIENYWNYWNSIQQSASHRGLQRCFLPSLRHWQVWWPKNWRWELPGGCHELQSLSRCSETTNTIIRGTKREISWYIVLHLNIVYGSMLKFCKTRTGDVTSNTFFFGLSAKKKKEASIMMHLWGTMNTQRVAEISLYFKKKPELFWMWTKVLPAVNKQQILVETGQPRVKTSKKDDLFLVSHDLLYFFFLISSLDRTTLTHFLYNSSLLSVTVYCAHRTPQH